MTSNNYSWSSVDISVSVTFIVAIVGLVWTPKLEHIIANTINLTQKVVISVDIQNMPTVNSAGLIIQAKLASKVQLIIRNQPHGKVQLQDAVDLTKCLVSLQPDGKILTIINPNKKLNNNLDARFILQGKGTQTSNGVVFGNQKLKIGTPIELEGENFSVNGIVSGLLVKATER
uniref:DUF4330 domain-containing protein n=1 Tax=Paulinella longichromatophora TaxID=1708747 RepID=A0A2H4ZNV0_9EUKA|nr:hypothetical protein PLO_182 [Paulinella longichromatophora]